MADAAPANLLADVSNALADMTAVAARSVVSIRGSRARSSGFVWRAGLIVTADDTLPDDGELAVTLPDGEAVAARVAGRDPTTDVALLRVESAGLTPATLATSPVRAGALALVVGADDGTPSAALGIVARAAGPWRSMRGGEIDARIELNVDMRRSAEGGLALDAAGQAIGMPVFGPRGRVLVIPAATIERVAVRLDRDGRIGRGYLGLGLQSVAVDGGKSGTMVINVDPNGPGAAAGVRQGDILLAWNGEAVGNVQTLLRALGPDSIGKTVTLDLSRAGEPMSVSVMVAEKPAA